MSREGSDGAASDGPIAGAGDEAVEGGIDRIVPRASGAAHDEGADEEDQVCAEEGDGGGSELGCGVQAAEEVGEIEVPEAVGAVETHELGVWEARGWDFGEPAGFGGGVGWGFDDLGGRTVMFGRGLGGDGLGSHGGKWQEKRSAEW